ncbi:MAG: FMN-dependent NADH-azoreductase [Cyanobium sp.]|uniref:FMN-dependent NADH-azoreductase n=1 Tax=Synechococcus sp. CS-1333 TaxID=2848638 RepID=UPI000DBBFA78|nr:FMN-dependent NADH-azoreductase [Synechococcus sp. CS-1333]MCT0210305.1 FMN-dependent NADH-azoreductase [Synechococcus sp. CS-1333]PZV23301.1 MAG: FMN-dependent NADH-azoreductase [Cyanobium sp.]
MKSILHLDASPRGERSRSRQLARKFMAAWQELHPGAMITYRDLRQTPIPHITESWIEADFTPPESLSPELRELLKLSDELVDEFLGADRCLFSVPMYNFSVPSSFKAYIDQIVRVGRTFTFEDGQGKGLVSGKKVLFITSRGTEFGCGSPYEGYDAQEPALRNIFQFMGVSDIQFIHASGLDMGEDAHKRGLEEAQSKIKHLVVDW